MNPDERDEQGLQEYLQGDSELSRLYRRDAEQTPGAELDARILDAARRAVSPAVHVVHSPFARHWMVPTSLAAVFVLSVSVVLLMPQPLDEPGTGVEESNRQKSAPDRTLDDAAGNRIDSEAPVPADAPAPMKSDARREPASGLPGSDAAGRASGAPLLPAAPSRDQAGEADVKSVEKRKAEAGVRQGDAAREAPSAAEVGASSAAEPPPAALRESAPASTRVQPGSPQESLHTSPEAWLSYIEVLLDAHDEAGAKQNLRAFRKRYPHYRLPASLREMADALDTEPP